MENDKTVIQIRNLIDPNSQEYGGEKPPYSGGKNHSIWASKNQFMAAVKLLGLEISLQDLDYTIGFCEGRQNPEVQSIQQFVKYFNREYKKK